MSHSGPKANKGIFAQHAFILDPDRGGRSYPGKILFMATPEAYLWHAAISFLMSLTKESHMGTLKIKG